MGSNWVFLARTGTYWHEEEEEEKKKIEKEKMSQEKGTKKRLDKEARFGCLIFKTSFLKNVVQLIKIFSKEYDSHFNYIVELIFE